ncbi:MAG: PEP-CTERM sorting domain-containing protein [Pirellulaceae bacterium]|nr:PEP-CTERM sorting domain-containing protein [Planctomycetales bacterium]
MRRASATVIARRILLSAATLAMTASCQLATAGTIDLNDTYNGGNPFMGADVMFTDTVETNGNAGDPAFNYYRDPTVLGNTLVVNPTNFRVEVIPGPGLGAIDSQLETVIMTKNGAAIQAIKFDEAGDYEILGNAFVKAELDYFYEVLEVNGSPVGSPITGNGKMVFDDTSPANDSGNWELGFYVPLDGAAKGATKVRFEFDNRVIAQADNDASLAFIAKKQISGVQVEPIVPEPATVGMFLLGLIGLVQATRKGLTR